MHALSAKGLFVTGTDTGVGKTVIGAGLVKKLYQNHVNIQPRKPVESGCVENGRQLIPADGLAYTVAVDSSVPLEIITPYRYRAPLAPPIAARLENQQLRIEQLLSAVYHEMPSDGVPVVEGAGGFYSPIAEDGLNADLARALKLPVLLVAADRLGCINHILLSLEAIRKSGLKCIAVVLNQADKTSETNEMNNAATLGNLITETVIESGHDDALAPGMDALYQQIYPLLT